MHQDCYELKIVEFHSFLVISKIHPVFFQPSAILAYSMNTVVDMIIETKEKILEICPTTFFLPKTNCFWDTSFSCAMQFQSCVWVWIRKIFWLCNNTVLNTKNWKGTLRHSLKNFWSNHNLLCKVDFRNMKILKCEHLNFTRYSVKYILKSAAVSSNINKCIGSSQCLKLWPQRRKQFAYVFVGLLWNNFNEVHKKLWTFF